MYFLAFSFLTTSIIVVEYRQRPLWKKRSGVFIPLERSFPLKRSFAVMERLKLRHLAQFPFSAVRARE